MNIFLIPSWYPSKKKPMAGSFIRDQALAIGKYHRQARVIISLWGDEGTKLNFEHPGEILSHLINHWQDKPYSRTISPRVYEFNQPVLEWSARIFRGNIKSIIGANRIDFGKAQERFGKIDLIHAHVSFPAGFAAMKLAEEFKVPYLITEHMGPFPQLPFDQNEKLLPLIIEPLKKANLVIAVSSKLQSELLKYKIKSVVIPNLVEENFFRPRFRPRSKNFSLFSLGEIVPEKGFEDLIEAMAIVLKSDRHFVLRIGGAGKFLKKYQERAWGLKIASHIQWLGFLNKNEVLHELQTCDAFILASHHESFGLVYLEALACGRPVIATRSGGPEDFVRKDNGLLVDIGNVDLIASAVIKLKHNIHYFEPKKIRREILKKYSSQAVAKKLIKFYQDLI